MKIRKKPIEVDGWPIADLLNIAMTGAASLPPLVREAYTAGLIEFEPEHLIIATMEGVMHGPLGWWLIRGVQGEWYPCEEQILMASYEIIPDEPQPPLIVGSAPDPYASGPS